MPTIVVAIVLGVAQIVLSLSVIGIISYSLFHEGKSFLK